MPKIKIGYKLCGEEQSPQELIDCARRAEEIGFDFAMISDHYHPWIDRQGQSSFVWSVLGGLSAKEEIEVYVFRRSSTCRCMSSWIPPRCRAH